MPLTSDFNKGNQWGPGRLDEIVSGRNELTEADYKNARAKSAYYAFPCLIKFKVESREINAKKLEDVRDRAFIWLDQNSTGRWFLDDKFDGMTSPLTIFIERKRDQDLFLAAFPDVFDVSEMREQQWGDTCKALGLMRSQQEEFEQWIKDNEVYSFSRDENGAFLFTFHDEDLKQKFIDDNAVHRDLQFISDNVCRIQLEERATNFPLINLDSVGEAFSLSIDGYRVRYPKQEQMMRDRWGDQLTDEGRDENGHALLRFTPREAENFDQVVAVYRRYVEGEIEWPDVLRGTGVGDSKNVNRVPEIR